MKKYLYNEDFTFDREVEIETDYFGKEVKYQFETLTPVPQVQEKEVALYNKATDSWDIVENHIGEQGFINNEPYQITKYGAYPMGWSKEYIESNEEILQKKINSIDSELALLDSKVVRSLMAIVGGTATQEDQNIFNEISAKKKELQAERETLLAPQPATVVDEWIEDLVI